MSGFVLLIRFRMFGEDSPTILEKIGEKSCFVQTYRVYNY